jgi:hypothetical protein
MAIRLLQNLPETSGLQLRKDSFVILPFAKSPAKLEKRFFEWVWMSFTGPSTVIDGPTDEDAIPFACLHQLRCRINDVLRGIP